MKNVKTFYLSINKKFKSAIINFTSLDESAVFTKDILFPNSKAINTILAPLRKKKYTISFYFNDKEI